MMQSLLSTGVGNTKNHEIKILKEAITQDKNSSESSDVDADKSSQSFTQIMQETLKKETEKATIKPESEVEDLDSSVQSDEIEITAEPLSPTIAELSAPLEEGAGLIHFELSQDVLEGGQLNANTVINSADEARLMAQLDPDNALQQKNLLAQIEAAQQVNTSVKSSAVASPNTLLTALNITSDSEVENVPIELLADDQESTALLRTAGLESSKLASSDKMLGIINSDLVAVDGEQFKLLEQSNNVTSLLKGESMVGPSVLDVNGAKPNLIGAAQLDKLVAFNQQAQSANNLLQQPLDLQSKQAAAMIGERVMMMISQGKQEVQIRLDPAELGSMFIKVQIQQEQVQLSIQTQMGLSKELIEQNMPRLREQLAQQGIQLGETNVQQQSQQQQQQHSTMTNSANQGVSGGNQITEELIEQWAPLKIPYVDQGIDYYA